MMTFKTTTKTIAKSGTFAIALAALAAPLAAQEADTSIDINGDGFYSFPELAAAVPDLTDATFTTLDTTGDGLLDMAEVEAGIQAGLISL